MGLDMYLNKKTYLWKDEEKESINGLPDGIKSSRISYIVEEVGYWRKANQVHKWFVDNVQDGEDDCKRYFVDKSKFMELKSIVDSVLSAPSTAGNLLPTTIGFFFGSQEYDEYYFVDLKETQQLLDKLFSDETVFDNYDFYYQASW